ncbi:MAG: AhpC/TSA family protein [Thermaceae bacterium]|nr:AhpC/TSA family protein [Thermaceae bacterium]
MSLQEQLAALQARGRAAMPSEIIVSMQRDLETLARSGLAQQSIQVGEQAPDFTLPDALGQPVTLSARLVQGPVVVAFYRGEWCPYCNLQLRAYQRMLPQLQELGASLVAISPQTPDHTLSLVEQQQLAFPVLSDRGNTVARRCRLIFSVPDVTRLIYQQQFGIDLPAFNGDDSWELPIPGTFLLDQQAKVRLAFVDVDYTHRLEPSALLEGLRELALKPEA